VGFSCFFCIIFIMKSTENTRAYEAEILQKKRLDTQSIIDQLQEKIRWYEEQFRLLKHQRFGASSEKCPEQMELFNEAESILDSLKPEDADACHLNLKSCLKLKLCSNFRLDFFCHRFTVFSIANRATNNNIISAILKRLFNADHAFLIIINTIIDRAHTWSDDE